MKILVVGGTGQVGRLIVSSLYKKYIELDAPPSSVLNLSDIKSIERYMKSRFFDYVFYCAIDKENEDFVNRNIVNLRNLLVYEEHFVKWVHISSRAVYDGLYAFHRIEPIDIGNLPIPSDNPYSILKYEEELLLASKISKKCIVLRMFDISCSSTFQDIKERWRNQIRKRGICRHEVLSPIHIDDLKSVIFHIVDGNVCAGIYNLCGNVTISSEIFQEGKMLEKTGKKSFAI